MHTHSENCKISQLLEQWTGNPEKGGAGLLSNHKFSKATNFVLISYTKSEVRKT